MITRQRDERLSKLRTNVIALAMPRNGATYWKTCALFGKIFDITYKG